MDAVGCEWPLAASLAPEVLRHDRWRPRLLKIKKLQIHGFKSFCDRTELMFPGSGVVGIVGPNGCGKSNLADAVCWVLGEQSVKSLRGQRMEDVIFAGSGERKPTGMAEVSLTLINPEEYEPEEGEEEEAILEINDGWDDSAPTGEDADAEGEGEDETAASAEGALDVVLTVRKRRRFVRNNRKGEIVVTRRLFRNGDSEYLMNGRPCRLRDIQDLFMGTGLGPDSYAIIEQGRIGQILSSKPHDRRAIIEEAAGVTKYKARRKLSEARLESAKQNLARINDIFEEVTRQMGSLKRQAAKAERYAALKSESDQQQRRLLLSKSRLMSEEHTRVATRHGELQQQLNAAQQKLQGEEAAREESGQRTTTLEQELRQMTQEASRLAMEVDRTERQINFNTQQSEDLQKRVTANSEEVEKLSQQRTALEGELERARQEVSAVAAELQAAREARQKERVASENESRSVQDLERKIETARRRVLTAMSQMTSFSNQVAQAETMLSGLDRQIARLQEEQETANSELEAFGVRRGQLDLQFQGQQEEKKGVEAELAALEKKLRELRDEEFRGRQERDRGRQQLAEVSARRHSLEEIVAHHGYSTETVKKLFAKGAAEQVRPLGTVADFLEVDAPHERVVEEFLREELNYVVVGSWDEAGAGLGLVQRQDQGRATFLVHPGEQTPQPAPEPELSGLLAMNGDGPVALRSCVRAVNGLGGKLEPILPKLRLSFIAADAAQARELSTRYPHAWFLTPQGDCYHNFTVTGGKHSNTGPLSLKRELRDLEKREVERQQSIQQLEARMQQISQELTVSQQQLEGLRARRHELEKQILTSSQSMKQLENEIGRVQSRLRLYQVEAERHRQEHRQGAERLEKIREQMARVEADRTAAEKDEAEAQATITEARERREQAAQRAAEAQSSLARLEERSRAAQEANQRLERNHRELAARLQQMQQDIERFRRQHEELQTASGELATRLEAMRQDRQNAEQRKAELETQLGDARTRNASIESELKVERESLEAVRKEFSQFSVALAKLETEATHLAELCRHDLGCELADLEQMEGIEPATVEEIPALEESARALRTKIDNLGPVNMMALEEFKETEERHTFLETQRKDLMDAIADTQKAIQEIDGICRQKFNEAFEKINAYFQETFKILFGGGQGFLRLTDNENDLDSGVDIVAQPPGKKLQNALLLSGGEKAMTAMALLLSVFRYQPSPFCVLDEVDAPLDEANVGRFTAMVKQMSVQTQFIIITHNKRTMEIAPILYGVTMHQPGVSRLVSVRVEEKPEPVGVV